MSLATGVTASNSSTYANTPSPPSTPEILPQSELPVPPNTESLPPLPMVNEYRQRVENVRQRVTTPFRPSPIAADLLVAQLLARIWSGVDLDQLAFQEGSITYQNLWNIDRNTHPKFYADSSDAADDNFRQPCLEDIEQQGEEEEEEESPSRTHLRIPESEHNSDKQSSENMSDRLERHLGIIIKEMF